MRLFLRKNTGEWTSACRGSIVLAFQAVAFRQSEGNMSQCNPLTSYGKLCFPLRFRW